MESHRRWMLPDTFSQYDAPFNTSFFVRVDGWPSRVEIVAGDRGGMGRAGDVWTGIDPGNSEKSVLHTASELDSLCHRSIGAGLTVPEKKWKKELSSNIRFTEKSRK